MTARARVSLAAALAHGLRAVWPSRRARESLLDLGERKDWSEPDLDEQVARVARWLEEELGLPVELPAFARPHQDALAWARTFGRGLHEGPAERGVSRWASALAPCAGTTGKTLANSVGGGLDPARADHRWIGVLSRIHDGRGGGTAWWFHARTPERVAVELARLAAPTLIDGGDALLLLSLLALWQRRRPTDQARGNRGTTRPRHVTPKPVASLRGELVQVGQLAHLAKLAEHLPPEAAHQLIMVAVECALTEAHLAPHRARAGRDDPGDGEAPLRAVERLMAHTDTVKELDREIIEFRVERMRAWRDGTRAPPVSGTLADQPYVAASQALEARRRGDHVLPRFQPSDPGLFMLQPLLRRRGLLVSP